MTEAEFKAAVKPIVAGFPTEERKVALFGIWMEAAKYHAPERLGALAREALYEEHPQAEGNVFKFPAGNQGRLN